MIFLADQGGSYRSTPTGEFVIYPAESDRWCALRYHGRQAQAHVGTFDNPFSAAKACIAMAAQPPRARAHVDHPGASAACAESGLSQTPTQLETPR